jgi:SAM-dependent methyltransferase
VTNAVAAASEVPAATPPGAGSAAGIFNSTVAGFAIGTAWELGALDEINDRGGLDWSDFATRHDLDRAATDSMFAALSAVEVVTRQGSRVEAGPAFKEVYDAKAFFHWLTIGCAELFADMPTVMRNANRVGSFYRRNPVAISYACRDINRQAFDPVFRESLEQLDVDFASVADLGCGSGERLIQLAKAYPGLRGLGIDIAASALRDAEVSVRAAGLADRIQFAEGDARNLRPDPRFAEVELLTCFMMGHDFWPRENCVASLRRLREIFPNARRLLLGDTARTQGIPDPAKPVFTLAFEVAHDLMGAYLPTLREWDEIFEEGGWKCLRARPVEIPTASVIYELA